MNNIERAYLAGFIKAGIASGMTPPIGAANQPPAQQAAGMQNSQPPAQQAPQVGQPQAPGGMNQFLQLVQQFNQQNGHNMQQPMQNIQSVKPQHVQHQLPPSQPQPMPNRV